MAQDSLFEQFRDANRDRWNASVNHRFVEELFAGTVSDDVMRHYLTQDYQFIDRFVALIGAAVASADRFESRVILTQFAAMITGEENTYFQRAFDALGVPEAERLSPRLTEPTRGFRALMTEAADSRGYANCIAVMCVAEALYLEWADQPERPLPPRFEHAEWITLHANDGFRKFVGWLKSELNRLGETQLDAKTRDEAATYFARAVALEEAFFDGAFQI